MLYSVSKEQNGKKINDLIKYKKKSNFIYAFRILFLYAPLTLIAPLKLSPNGCGNTYYLLLNIALLVNTGLG